MLNCVKLNLFWQPHKNEIDRGTKMHKKDDVQEGLPWRACVPHSESEEEDEGKQETFRRTTTHIQVMQPHTPPQRKLFSKRLKVYPMKGNVISGVSCCSGAAAASSPPSISIALAACCSRSSVGK